MLKTMRPGRNKQNQYSRDSIINGSCTPHAPDRGPTARRAAWACQALHAWVKLDAGLFAGGVQLHAGAGPRWRVRRQRYPSDRVQVDTGDPYEGGTFFGPTDTVLHIESITAQWRLDAEFVPNEDRTFADLFHGQWGRAVERSREQPVGDPAE